MYNFITKMFLLGVYKTRTTTEITYRTDDLWSVQEGFGIDSVGIN